MKALVTGASGFIGSTLIEELNILGFEVFALLRKSSNIANLEGLRYTRVEGDLGDFESLKRAAKGMNYVFHLAGLTAAPSREVYFEHNAAGTGRLARAVAEADPDVCRFVYVSSLAAAGPAASLRPRVESEDDQPVSLYGKSKLQGERELLKFRDRLPISIVRPPMVYGPKDKGVYVIIRTISRNIMPILQGSTVDGHKYYSAVHVKDLVRGIVQAAVVPKEKVSRAETFYITGDGFHTYQDFLGTIAECLNKDPFKIKIPKFAIKAAAAGMSAAGYIARKTFPLNLDKVNEILPDYWICSNEKAKRMLDFSPEFDLRGGMTDAIAWYKRHQWI